MKLVKEVEAASALSQLSETTSSVLIQGSEAGSVASSDWGEDLMLELSVTEDSDVLSFEAGEFHCF